MGDVQTVIHSRTASRYEVYSLGLFIETMQIVKLVSDWRFMIARKKFKSLDYTSLRYLNLSVTWDVTLNDSQCMGM